ncbi:hypothetical protein BTJ68_13768 [Hortaea werneckii EXF-2000]|uniref:Thioredoxin-like fold domain-containing protein n=2 Tax=Hortaea werneckii TaxID=91943 RepID=A0A3M7GNY9_HORWE|nr:hypothetical protein BTJ68_13768 [Hortaea werneckii EXF-2000]RMZ02870.1 hypothetical protein D0860_07029 [Hortaea werneckii]RMZ25057.1 hypothetical protein D0859_10893 [Hortaea werneckii]
MAMPDDDTTAVNAADTSNRHVSSNKGSGSRSWRDLFAIPPPVKRVFDKVPLVTYEANELPARAPRDRGENVLYVFTTEDDAQNGRPSFNPSCLRWQAYLKFHSLPFSTAPSSNHASPSGSLPFLLPADHSSDSYFKTQEAVTSSKLKKWITQQRRKDAAAVSESEDVRYEAYASLLDNRIRRAWLYQLYLNPANATLLHELYIAPCSSNPFVQLAIAHQLRDAATIELTKSLASETIVEDELMREADEAFSALSQLLGKNDWFFELDRPSLFDANVFSYTHLLVDQGGLQWGENRLGGLLKQHENLLRHQERVVSMYL